MKFRCNQDAIGKKMKKVDAGSAFVSSEGHGGIACSEAWGGLKIVEGWGGDISAEGWGGTR